MLQSILRANYHHIIGYIKTVVAAGRVQMLNDAEKKRGNPVPAEKT